jgi:hypothetical protein
VRKNRSHRKLYKEKVIKMKEATMYSIETKVFVKSDYKILDKSNYSILGIISYEKVMSERGSRK